MHQGIISNDVKPLNHYPSLMPYLRKEALHLDIIFRLTRGDLPVLFVEAY